jgi:anti-sigma regulatory factor (Ser/Thr protein kinase)
VTGALTNSVTLVAVATAVPCARRFTAETLRQWNVSGAPIDDACLITSELVTNAVRATGTLETDPSPETLASLPHINLKLTVAQGQLLVQVADNGEEPPQMQQQYEASTGGRGLFLVTMLAERWSYYSVGGGKVVWAELKLPQNRERGGAADVATLERVLWGMAAHKGGA